MILIDIIEYMERKSNIELTFDLDKLKPQGSFDEKKISNDFLINYIPDLDDKIILEKMKSTNDKMGQGHPQRCRKDFRRTGQGSCRE